MSKTKKKSWLELGIQVFLASSAVAFLLLAVWLTSVDIAVRHELEAIKTASSVSPNLSPCTNSGNESLACAVEAARSTRAEMRAELDTRAQQSVATSTYMMLLVGIASLVLTAIALWFVRGTLIASRDAVREASESTNLMRLANQIMEETRDREHRAWLDFQLSNVSMTIGDQLIVSSDVTIENIGNIPATRSYLVFEVMIHQSFWKLPDLSEILKFKARQVASIPKYAGEVFFPNQKGETQKVYWGTGGVPDISKWKGSPEAWLTLAVRLSYLSSGKEHFTDHYYRIDGRPRIVGPNDGLNLGVTVHEAPSVTPITGGSIT